LFFTTKGANEGFALCSVCPAFRRVISKDISSGQEFFFVCIARNPLKRPESDERIQENPSLFIWSGLDWLGFGLGKFWPEAFHL